MDFVGDAEPGSETKPLIQESLDVRRRLGELLLDVGCDPLPFEESDHWVGEWAWRSGGGNYY